MYVLPIHYRLSANFEAVVRDDNDKITKVTDDSPIKIAEQFKETYDNEYTYAFDEMEEMGLNAGIETSTKRMLDILEVCTVKPVLGGHSKNRPKIGFKSDYRLMQVKSNKGRKYCRMLSWSILQYFRPLLSYHIS